jgi:uncharacterized membrane protein YoaK (UPF0700 family)
MSHHITIAFKEKKHLSKFVRNLKKGKGSVVSAKHLEIGEGFFDTLKSVAKVVAPVVAPMVGQEVAKATGSSTAGNMVTGALKASGKGMKKGKGFFDTLKNVGKAVAPIVAPMVGQEVAKATGSSTAGNMVTGALKASGKGLKKRGRPKKGSGFVNGIGGEIPNEVCNSSAVKKKFNEMDKKERMAYVRGHRKKGGSFAPLG